jgi:hypothetical protein
MMKEDWHKQSEQSSDQIKFCEHDCRALDSDIVISFRRIKHLALKTICIDPLSTTAEHHVANKYINKNCIY